MVSNDEMWCSSCDLRIGFGTGRSPDNSNTCSKEADSWDTSWYNKHDSAFAKKSDKSNRQYTVFPVSSATSRIGLMSVYNFGFTLDQSLAMLSINSSSI